MKIVHARQARTGGASAHRPGGVAFTYLLEGEEFAPDNFCLMLVHVEEHYHAPSHRHNFEQVRVMLDGSFGFGPGRTLEAGSVGYFSEGVSYTQDGRGPSTTLLLQLGGASGQGYMSEPQLRAGVSALQSEGTFRDGLFERTDPAGGRRLLDGYEAVWQHAFGKPVTYPEARFDGPVIFQPERFSWVAVPGRAGVWGRHLASFHERGLELHGWRLEAGAAADLETAGRRVLAYVMRGEASVDGDRRIGRGDALELRHQDRPTLVAGAEGVEMLRFVLPVF